MDWKHITNVGDKTASINLFSDIGTVSAQDFANEMMFLDSMSLENIEVHINSKGGSVFEGFGILMAIKNASTYTTTINDGIAFSMAGVILQAGDERKMVDFGQLMIHDPSFSGKEPENDKQKDVLQRIKDSLVQIFAGATRRKKPTTIAKLMNEETFFTAQEAMDAGLIDEIIPTGRKKMHNATVDEILNYANDLQTKPNKMEKLTNHFELENDATEAEVLAKVTELESKLEAADSTAKEEKTNHEGTITALDEAEADLKALKVEVATLTVENAISTGKVDDKKKDDLIAQATENIENFRAIIGAIKAPAVKITETIVSSNEEKSLTDWQKNDPNGLLDMLQNSPEQYATLYKKEHGVEPKLNHKY